MKTVLVRKPGGPDAMEIVDVPDLVPGRGEVVVRNHSVSVTGPHILVRENRYRFPPTYPTGMGTESVGHVHKVGPGVTDLKIGDPVYVSWRLLPTDPGPGFYGEQMLMDARAAMKLPEGIDLEVAAGLGNYSSAWAMLNEAPCGRPYQTVLVVGSSGSLGSCLVELAHHMDKTVIGLVSSPQKAAYVKSRGADHTINYRTENIVQRVRELTGGKGVDLLVDHLGGPNFTDYYDMLGKWGLIVSINGVDGSPRKDAFEEGRNHAKSAVSVIFFAMHVYEMDFAGQKRVVDGVLPLMMAGKLKSDIVARFPLADVRKSHELLESGKAMGRILLQP